MLEGELEPTEEEEPEQERNNNRCCSLILHTCCRSCFNKEDASVSINTRHLFISLYQFILMWKHIDFPPTIAMLNKAAAPLFDNFRLEMTFD